MSKSYIYSHKKIILFFLYNLIALFTLSYIAFNKNNLSLFYGLDGAYMMDIVRQQFKFGLFSWFGSTSNIFQSLNNIYFPLNSNLIPGYAISAIFNNNEINKTLSYIIFTTEIFFSIYIFSIAFKFKPATSLLGGWLFVLLAFPYVGLPKIYAIFTLVPHFCTGIAESYIIMLLIIYFSKPVTLINIMCAIAVSIVSIHMTIFCPNMIILILPWLIVFALSQFVILNSSNQRKRFIFTATLASLIISFSVFIFYYYGLFRYTAATFFPTEMLCAKSKQTISILFSKSKTEVLFFALGIIGAAFEAFKQNSIRKSLAIALLIFTTCLVAFGYYTVFFQTLQSAPYILYFEFCVWPLYAIYAANLIFYIPFVDKLYKKTKFTSIMTFIFPVFIIVGYFIISNTYNYSEYKFPYPPATTDIVEHLKSNISLQIGSRFNGRVATFDGLQQELTTWYTLPKFNGYAKVDYHLLDLSYNDIPTLFEYSPLISPVFYTFTKHFLVQKQDQQTRNVVVMRKIDTKILSLLGVRYIITDTAINTNATLVKQSAVPQALLYEISDVNIGQYSPVFPIVINNAKAALLKMAEPDFNFKNNVILQNKTIEKFVPAENIKINLEKNGILHVTGSSIETSLIVLPIEFSNCLNIIDNKYKNNPQLIRTNVLLTGLIFKNELDIRIKYYTGLGYNSYCRMSDVKDAKNMGIIGKID